MANLATSGVTVIDSWYNGHDRKVVSRRLRVVLAAMGTAANKIEASILGFRRIESCTPLIISDNTVLIQASPSYDGSLLLLKAAGTNAPADFTGTYEMVVTGRM